MGIGLGENRKKVVLLIEQKKLIFKRAKMSQETDHLSKMSSLLQARNEAEITAFIKANPAVLHQKDKNGVSGLMLIAYHRLPTVMAEVPALANNFAFHEAITYGLLPKVEEALEADPSLLDQYSSDGFTPVCIAAFFSQEAIVKFLLEAGANPNLAANNPAKVAPIHAAVAANHIGLVELLIQYKADVNAQQTQGVTALHSAAHRGNLPMVQLLVEAGADKSTKMDSGETALDYAKKDGHEAVEQYLSA